MSEFDEGGTVHTAIVDLQNGIYEARDKGHDMIAFGKSQHMATLNVTNSLSFLMLLSQVAGQALPEAQGAMENYALNLIAGIREALFNFIEFGSTIPERKA